MKFLLVGINSKFIHSNPAVYSLKSYVTNEIDLIPNADVEIAEYTINQRCEEILSDIFERRPDYIGFSCYIWNRSMVCELLDEIPKVLPGTEVFLGGPEVSFEKTDIFTQKPCVKAIMLGEGEETFRQLLTEYCIPKGENESLRKIPGLLLPDGTTSERGILDMDDVPFFYDKDIFSNKIVYYESSRGCPFRCSYCLSSIDKDMRYRSLDKVFEHLDTFLKSEVPQVKFIDRTFNSNPKRALEIWKYILKNDNGVTNFHFEIAADIMTDEQIDVISRMRTGLIQLEIGVQSTNEKTLKSINRFVDTEHIKKVVGKLQAANNTHIHLDLIAGLPYENYESFQKSFNDVFDMRPNQLQLGFLKVLKGTMMAKQTEEYGIKHCSAPPYEVLSSRWISYEEILKLKRIEEVLELYYNSAQFVNSVDCLLKEFDTAFDFFDALAKYYVSKGYFIKSPARSRKYDILLEFTEQINPQLKEKIRELLTLDYYLRENPKSKPDFVKEVPKMKFDYTRRNPLTNNATLMPPNC